MNNYFLVIDTETSGLPKKWDLPYDAKGNWPFVVQIAWIVFDKLGNEIKRENHYIKNTDFKISKSSQNVHHITSDFLQKNGKSRKHVMQRFAKDMATYQPLIVAHYVELDYHMINTEFFRLGIESSIKEAQVFCTMKASVPYIKNPSLKYLKLNRFYKTLFNKRPEQLHNALVDAELTAEIFFHLLQKGEVSDKAIAAQKNALKIKNKKKSIPLIWILLLIIIALLIIFILVYNGQ